MKDYIIQMTCIMHFKINLGYWCWLIPLTLGTLSQDFLIFPNYFNIFLPFLNHRKKETPNLFRSWNEKNVYSKCHKHQVFQIFFFIFMKQAFLCFTYATDLKFCKRVKNNTYMSKTIHHNHLLMIICYAVNMLM